MSHEKETTPAEEGQELGRWKLSEEEVEIMWLEHFEFMDELRSAAEKAERRDRIRCLVAALVCGAVAGIGAGLVSLGVLGLLA